MENLVVNSDFWIGFWRKISSHGTGLKFRDDLIKRYSESHRLYHTTQHLNECLQIFNNQHALSDKPEEIFFAIWYHDAIYKTTSHDNEKASANLAKNDLSESGVAQEKISRIIELILATEHSASPLSFDQKLIVDIDLSILGAANDRFMEYEQQIKQEYSFVPNLVFKKKRKEILKSFLDRPTIYNTPYFIENLEARARLNLTRTIL